MPELGLVEGPVFVGGMADALFEQAAEMLRVFESEVVGDLADGSGCIEDAFFGDFDQFGLDVFLCGLAPRDRSGKCGRVMAVQ